jgi:hypothetical protein
VKRRPDLRFDLRVFTQAELVDVTPGKYRFTQFLSTFAQRLTERKS